MKLTSFVSQLNRCVNVSKSRITIVGRKQIENGSLSTRRSAFHTCAPRLCLNSRPNNGREGETSDHDRSNPTTKVFLLQNPISSIMNWWQLLTLKKEWDPSFDSDHFIYGAKQAVVTVSSLISNDSYDMLRSEGLLSSKAAEGVKHESQHLDRVSKASLKIKSEDIHVATVQGVNLQTIVDHRYADIDVLFVATKYGADFFGGRDTNQRRPVVIYISSRFQREYTEGVIPSWVISSITYRFTGLE